MQPAYSVQRLRKATKSCHTPIISNAARQSGKGVGDARLEVQLPRCGPLGGTFRRLGNCFGVTHVHASKVIFLSFASH